MQFITSWDDGYKKDVGLASMLKSYNIPGIFFIPNMVSNFSRENAISEEEIKQLYREGFEIGGHTYSHPSDLKTLNEPELIKEILVNKKYLEKLIGAPVKKFAYPSGKYNEQTIEILKKVGYIEARTTVQGSIDVPLDPYRIKTSIHVYPETKRFNKPDWLREAQRLYAKAKKEKTYFHLWGHSWELEKFNLWGELDSFFKLISKDKSIWVKKQ